MAQQYQWECTVTPSRQAIECRLWPQLIRLRDQMANPAPLPEKKLFIQSCYPRLYDLALSHIETDEQGNFATLREPMGIFIYGTPGIGKSCFLDYALKRLLDAGRTVLYLHGPKEMALIFTPRHVGRHDSTGATMETHHMMTSLEDGIAERADIILYDPPEDAKKTDIPVDLFQCKTVIVGLCPDWANCKKIRKDLAFLDLYMGTLTRAEATSLRNECFAHIDNATLDTRFSAFGGIARSLFETRLAGDPSDSALQKVLEKQKSALNIMLQNPLLIDTAGKVSEDFKNLWTVFHLQPLVDANGNTDHREYSIEVCHEDFRVKIRDHLMRMKVNDLWCIYAWTRDGHGTLKGIRYEAYAHKKISVHGLNGMAIPLTTNARGQRSKRIVIPAGLEVMSLPSNDVQNSLQDAIRRARTNGGAYLLPETSNFPVVDSIYVSSRASASFNLQMKAGRSKPLAAGAASQIYAATSTPLIFVVPDASIIRARLPFTGAAEGPSNWKQYRVVLREGFP